jgi:hypothetical protein
MRDQDGRAGGGRAKVKAKAGNGGKVAGGARGNGANGTLCRRDDKKNKKGLRVGNGVARGGGGGSEKSKTTAAAKGAKRGSAVGKRKTRAEVYSLYLLYWYKSTNTYAERAGGGGRGRSADGVAGSRGGGGGCDYCAAGMSVRVLVYV